MEGEIIPSVPLNVETPEESVIIARLEGYEFTLRKREKDGKFQVSAQSPENDPVMLQKKLEKVIERLIAMNYDIYQEPRARRSRSL